MMADRAAAAATACAAAAQDATEAGNNAIKQRLKENLEPQTTIYKWMFGETTIFFVRFGIIQLKHPFINGCLGFQEYKIKTHGLQNYSVCMVCIPSR